MVINRQYQIQALIPGSSIDLKLIVEDLGSQDTRVACSIIFNGREYHIFKAKTCTVPHEFDPITGRPGNYLQQLFPDHDTVGILELTLDNWDTEYEYFPDVDIEKVISTSVGQLADQFLAENPRYFDEFECEMAMRFKEEMLKEHEFDLSLLSRSIGICAED
ncbi:hypothetical protein [Loigolactobacillus bifermentans]|jgi:hypothetical protein|nr:hypothetical protein [Loigolactobacillus bifermentans]QGG62008.1 hypothetical protein LB003_15950 [Loigolactobacillus bifermentans]